MKNNTSFEMMLKSIENNLNSIVKNMKIIRSIANYMNDKYDIDKSTVYDLFNDFDSINTMDMTEVALLGERIAIEAGDSKNWLNKYFTGEEIVNMRNYKRLRWDLKPKSTVSRKTSFIFNAGYKNAFINNFEIDNIQRSQALGLFRNIGKFELKLNKDLFEMNQSEIELMLSNVGYKSSNSVIRDIVLINKYINWSIANGFIKKSDITLTTARKDIDKYVYRNLNTVYTKDELFNALQKTNKLLYMVSLCIFNGIGAVDFSEIQNLKSENLIIVDGDYFVELKRGLIQIDKYLYDKLLAFDKIDSLPNSKFKFVQTDTIFKPYHRSVNKIETVMNPSVRNRIMNFMKEELEDDSFTTRTILKSGINYFTYKLMYDSKQFKLTTDLLNRVSNRFNVHKNKIGHYQGRMLDELNFEFIKTNYGSFDIDDKLFPKLAEN